MFDKNGPTFRELVQQALSSTQRGYDMLAPKFENTPFCTPEEVIEKAVADLGPVGDALDLCTGTGTALPSLRDVATGRVVGVDFSRGMLDVAEKRLPALRMLAPDKPAVELVQKDIFEIDYEAAFDLVTCFGALGHIEKDDEPKFIAAIRRALRPGGRFVFLTTDEPPAFSRARILSTLFNAVMRVRNAVISPPFIMYYLTFLLPDVERHFKWYGFKVEATRDLFDKPWRPVVRVIATRS